MIGFNGRIVCRNHAENKQNQLRKTSGQGWKSSEQNSEVLESRRQKRCAAESDVGALLDLLIRLLSTHARRRSSSRRAPAQTFSANLCAVSVRVFEQRTWAIETLRRKI